MVFGVGIAARMVIGCSCGLYLRNRLTTTIRVATTTTIPK